MQRFIVLIAASAAFTFLVSEASATKITEQQVRNTCGGSLQSGCIKGACAQGCDKKCGSNICTYNCCQGEKCGEQGCHGHVVGRAAGANKTKMPRPASIRQQ